MIFDAAEREIRSMGLDPVKVTYEQLLGEIERLKDQRKAVQAEYRGVSKDLRDMEKQLEMMRGYIERNAPQQSKITKTIGKTIGQEK